MGCCIRVLQHFAIEDFSTMKCVWSNFTHIHLPWPNTCHSYSTLLPQTYLQIGGNYYSSFPKFTCIIFMHDTHNMDNSGLTLVTVIFPRLQSQQKYWHCVGNVHWVVKDASSYLTISSSICFQKQSPSTERSHLAATRQTIRSYKLPWFLRYTLHFPCNHAATVRWINSHITTPSLVSQASTYTVY